MGVVTATMVMGLKNVHKGLVPSCLGSSERRSAAVVSVKGWETGDCLGGEEAMSWS